MSYNCNHRGLKITTQKTGTGSHTQRSSQLNTQTNPTENRPELEKLVRITKTGKAKCKQILLICLSLRTKKIRPR